MTDYQLVERCYVLPAPAGAFYATGSNRPEPARRLLMALLDEEQSSLLSVPQACKWTGMKNQEDVLALLYRVQSLGWIQGEADARPAPAGSLEELLPPLLAQLSGEDKALLADSQGFYLARHGYSHETAEELSALGADLLALHKRHSGLLDRNMHLQSEAWAVVDAAGNSKQGFWPLHIGHQHFVLILSGAPCLNQPAFVELVWALNKRYRALGQTSPSLYKI